MASKDLNEKDLKTTQNKYLEHIKYFNSILSRTPNDTDTIINKATALCALDRFEEGIQCYNKAIKINPNDYETIMRKSFKRLETIRRSNKMFRY